MLTLRQALDAAAPVLAPSARFARPKVQISDGELRAYNGQVAAHARFRGPDLEGRSLAVDAETFARVWTDTCTLQCRESDVVVRAARARYTLPLAPVEEFVSPEVVTATNELSEAARDAIHMAARFASDNAIHLWACGVTLTGQHAVANNNVACVRVACATPYVGTLPFWAVQTLRRDGPCPRINLDENSVTLSYADGIDLRSQLLSAEMPPKLFDLVADLRDADVPTSLFSGVLEEVFALGGRHCTIDLNAGLVTVAPEGGFEAQATLERTLNVPPVRLQGAIARVILESATHIGFERAPNFLTFSRDVHPRFVGLCAAIVGGE